MSDLRPSWTGTTVAVCSLVLVLGACKSTSEQTPEPEDPFEGLELAPPPWQRTETRETCESYDGLRRPYFGEQHVHTALSFDAYGLGTRGGPREAYDFAKGMEVNLPDENGGLTRTGAIDRPLDWLMVADHALFFGEVRECITASSGGYDDPLCEVMRDPFGSFLVPWQFSPIDFSGGSDPALVKRPDLCSLPGVDCDTSAVSVWQEIQAAAEEAYDRTANCSFTAFIGYEHTANLTAPLVTSFDYVSSVHRNLMFRNDVVPERPQSAIDSAILDQTLSPPSGDPAERIRGVSAQLWDYMEQECNEADGPCEVLAIPHNSNLSAGLMWVDPLTREEAERRRKHEPVVEIMQQKGASECRYDRLAAAGVGTADELCAFEQQTDRSTIRRGADLPVDEYFPRNHVRNALKDGMVFEETLGANPFEFGVVGSTDNHVSAPANTTEDEDWTGMRGAQDANLEERIASDLVIEKNPGGLAVAWAEENSRDSIFKAFARREVYATSGHRPYLRFFAGDLADDLCDRPDLVESAYRQGVPMGSVIGAARNAQSPRFLVHAMKDPGGGRLPGTDLQRVQIIKGWVDDTGETREEVFEVAGDPDNGAGVNPETCAPTGSGFADLCEVWEDPGFDPDQRSFYYVRALDNPTCRWSTLTCQSLGVNPFSPTCEEEAGASESDLANCCISEEDEPFFSPIVQERAWSSPIWYKPDAIARVSGQLVRSREGDSLDIEATVHALPSSFDPSTSDLTLRISDNDEIYAVTVSAGGLTESGQGQFAFADASGQLNGLREVSLTIGEGETTVRFVANGMSLANVQLKDHFIEVEVSFGNHRTGLSTLWTSDGMGTLEP